LSVDRMRESQRGKWSARLEAFTNSVKKSRRSPPSAEGRTPI
jgi:hypothetical protein